MKQSPHPNTIAALGDDKFWDTFFLLFCVEEKVKEFSEISNVSVEQITAARTDYLQRGYLRRLMRGPLTSLH
jgi:hypothetical protein